MTRRLDMNQKVAYEALLTLPASALDGLTPAEESSLLGVLTGLYERGIRDGSLGAASAEIDR